MFCTSVRGHDLIVPPNDTPDVGISVFWTWTCKDMEQGPGPEVPKVRKSGAGPGPAANFISYRPAKQLQRPGVEALQVDRAVNALHEAFHVHVMLAALREAPSCNPWLVAGPGARDHKAESRVHRFVGGILRCKCSDCGLGIFAHLKTSSNTNPQDGQEVCSYTRCRPCDWLLTGGTCPLLSTRVKLTVLSAPLRWFLHRIRIHPLRGLRDRINA